MPQKAGGCAETAETEDKYPEYILSAIQKADSDYDKNLLWLLGGALGLSFAFVKEAPFAPPWKSPWPLITAWVIWSMGLFCMLLSFRFSSHALRKTWDQYCAGELENEGVRPGGGWSVATTILNYAGGAALFLGVVSFVVFVIQSVRLCNG